ncbi:DUF2239 family protein [Paraburkholderia lacunae]|uniref:DUF2239 domain-containing protein n=1 Tax=Paraburkholderia lacunae TaxID=2211104 RepID=A0A370NER1_9BURK|nr:DUF2239 family protein [Paraburkholderia lacunae]RDK04080.1 DUF2239 domain-containing protein [Paraburkholderia lacunae]
MTPYIASCTAFEGLRRIASGALPDVALAVRAVFERGEQAPVLIFDDVTSRPVEFDLRGTPEEIVARLASQESGEASAQAADATEDDAAPRGRGRPKLGVVAREVTLLPRHWDWLNGQPGGASVALRKLVDAARSASEDKDRKRAAQEAVYRFTTALAGNLPGYEDATRALYADDRPRFEDIVSAWPADVRDHTLRLAAHAFVTLA